MGPQSPEVPTICPRETKISNKEPAQVPKTLILKPTSSQLTTKFHTHSALMKQKHKTFGHQLAVGKKNSRQ